MKDFKEKYFYTKCLHPRKVLNKYTGQSVLAPCGHCIVCEHAKSSQNSIRCHCESLNHEYMYFITLTYAPEYLPTASLVPMIEHYDNPDEHGFMFRHRLQEGYYLVSDIDGDVLGEYYPKKHTDMLSVVRKCNISSESDVYRKVPVLYKPDIQKFMKRLRKYLSNLTDEKIRYFCCGEYGPKYYRPHYHILLWCSQEITAAYIDDAVHQCWKFGRTDCSQSFGGASNYVAKYVNGGSFLPQIFRMAFTKPFSTHSIHLGDQIFKTTTEEFEESDPRTALSVSVPFGNENTCFSMWRSVKNTLFPKCQGFYQKSESQRCYAYQIYEVAREWIGEIKTIDIARYITSHVVDSGFTHFLPRIKKLLTYFKDSCHFLVDELHQENYERFQLNVYRQLLLSKYFLNNICYGNINLVPHYVRKISSYYDMCERLLLQEQFKIQEKDLNFKREFYYVTEWDEDTINHYINDETYLKYKSNVKSDIRNGMKHKYLNDANKIFNYK